MSFILDALKKSETERQEQSAAEFSKIPSSPGSSSPLRWLWLLAALLLVNVAVLLVILLRPGDNVADQLPPVVAQPLATTPAVAAPAVAAPAVAAQQAAQSFEERVADAVVNQPAVSQVPETEPRATSAVRPVANIPTLDQLRLSGATDLPELHLDIHVYSDDPTERFVFINMNKHREGARIEAGAQIDAIRPDGVVLEYRGQTFLLPRQ